MFKWSILELISNGDESISVKYNLSATDGKNTVDTEGYYSFSKVLNNKPFSEIKESDLVDLLDNDHSEDQINGIKQNLLKQLKDIEKNQKVEFPWLANTFTI